MKIRAFNLHHLSFWYHKRLKGIFCFALREPDQAPAYRSSLNSRGFIFLIMTDHLSRGRSGGAVTWEDVWSPVYRQKLWSPVYRQELTGRALGSCYYITLWLWARGFIYLCLSSNPPATLPSPWADPSLLFINAPGSLEIAHPKMKPTVICSEGAEEGMLSGHAQSCSAGSCGHCWGTERVKLQQQRPSLFINSLIVCWKERQTLPPFCWCLGFHLHNKLHVKVAVHPSQNWAPGGLSLAVLLQLGMSLPWNNELSLLCLTGQLMESTEGVRECGPAPHLTQGASWPHHKCKEHCGEL